MDKVSISYRQKMINEIKKKHPLVHCITNVITINDCANVVLAVGGSPTMAHHFMEVEEITSNSDVLVCNMGATECMESIFISCKEACKKGIPIVLDPVGVAASSYRREKCIEIMNLYTPTCIRGNAGEIAALYYNKSMARGVDVEVGGSDNSLLDKEAIAKKLAERYKTIVVLSGKTDIVTNGKKIFYISKGSEMMTKITGAGCMSTALIGTYVATDSSIESIASACIYMGEAAYNAEKYTLTKEGGTMTFRSSLIDIMYKSCNDDNA